MYETPENWRLRARGLSIRRGSRSVLKNIDFEMRAGECVSIIGPNGAGKTTLLLALLGLLHAESGAVSLNDTPLKKLTARQRGVFAAYVPQGIDRVPEFTVRDVIEGGRFAHLPLLQPLRDIDRQAIHAAIATCGLAALADRPFAEVSAGERQKTLLAAAFAQDAQVLFLDEPNTALDPAYQIELVRLLRIWQSRGRSLMLISHDLQLPAALGGRLIAMREGVFVADGPVTRMLNTATLNSVFGTTFEVAQTADGRSFFLPAW